MEGLKEFNHSKRQDNWKLEDLNPNTNYCAMAWLNSIVGGNEYSYKLVDCDGDQEAYSLCIKEPQTKRRKRETEELPEASLDAFFKNKDQSKLKLEDNASEAKAKYKANFMKMNLEKSYAALFEILWYTQLPCFDVENVTSEYRDQYGMLKGCFWKGVEVPCSKVFDTFPTDQGMCCTFNTEKAEAMFKNGRYSNMVTLMQARDRDLSFDRKIEMPGFWEGNNEPISEAGRSKGLSVILDAHSNLLAGGTVSQDFDGFFAIIDSKNQYPTTTRKSVLLRPGHNNFVSMSATKIVSSDIIDIEPERRNCYFHHEKKLAIHTKYTQANCMLECQLSYALSKV